MDVPGEKTILEAHNEYMHAAEGPYSSRFDMLLYEAVLERLPAIDGTVPFGKAIVRYGAEV